MKKLGPVAWSKEVTLGSLWQNWMDLNGLTVQSAQKALIELGVRGGDNLPLWLKDEPTIGMLTTGQKMITEKTGIDLDGWIVCEAKRQVLRLHPEWSDQIRFDRMTTREAYCEELSTWRGLYDSVLYLAIQLRVTLKQALNWTQRNNYPSLEGMKQILIVLTQGLVVTESREDLIFTLICRCFFNRDPAELFEVATFRAACTRLFAPYRGYTSVRKEKELELPRHIVLSIEEYIDGKATKFPLDTIEKVIAGLLRNTYPKHVQTFTSLCSVYRLRERDGIWKIPAFINVFEDPKTELIDTPEPVQCVPQSAPALRATIEYVVNKPESERTEESLQRKKQDTPPPQELPPVPDESVQETPIPQTDELFQVLAQVFAFGAHKFRQASQKKTNSAVPTQPVSVSQMIGTEIDGVRSCLHEASYRPTSERINSDQIEQIRLAIEQLRRLLVLVNRLDRRFVREELKPILGPELFELFLAGQGMEHLLHTPEAWQIIAAQRESATINKKLKGN